MRIIKFRHLTEGQWLVIAPEDRLPDTRYTVYNQSKTEILFEWQGALITTNTYNREEVDDKLANLEIDGKNLEEVI